MTVGVIGLGLIGGSMAKAYKRGEHRVYADDIDEKAIAMASADDVIDGRLDAETLGLCDVVYVALYPDATVEAMKRVAPYIRKDAFLLDLCGVKRAVTEVGFLLAREYGFTYVGAHPMAGTQFSGLSYSRSTLFSGAPMVLVLPDAADSSILTRVKELLSPVGFGRISVTSSADHDRMIAFTSQLAHVVSNAYIKSPTAERHRGFSAGSYKDMTRVAWLNETMWTELFLDNRDYLADEIDTIIRSLSEYRDALKNEDADRLCALLRDGRLAKERVDG